MECWQIILLILIAMATSILIAFAVFGSPEHEKSNNVLKRADALLKFFEGFDDAPKCLDKKGGDDAK